MGTSRSTPPLCGFLAVLVLLLAPGCEPERVSIDDPDAMEALFQVLGIPALRCDTSTEKDPLPRALVTPIVPNGRVRREALAAFVLEVGIDYEDDGRLEFRLGSEVLHSEPFVPDRVLTTSRLPASVLGRVERGDRLVWGVVFEDEARSVTVEVLVDGDGEATRDLQTLAKDPRFARQHTDVRLATTGAFLLARGHASEAFLAFNRLIDGDRKRVLAWRGALAALQTMGVRCELSDDVRRLLAGHGRAGGAGGPDARPLLPPPPDPTAPAPGHNPNPRPVVVPTPARDDVTVVLLWPRMDVRREVLAHGYCLEYAGPPGFGARICFYRGRQRLSCTRLVARNGRAVGPIPRAVLAALRPNDKIRWGVEVGARREKRWATTFKLVAAKRLREALRGLPSSESSPPAHSLDPAIRRAELLFDHRHYSEALVEALALQTRHPDDRRVHELVDRSLTRAGVKHGELAATAGELTGRKVRAGNPDAGVVPLPPSARLATWRQRLAATEPQAEAGESRSGLLKALAYWGHRLESEESRRHPAYRAAVLSRIGHLHYALADYPRAIETLQEAHGLLEDLEDDAGTAGVLVGLGISEEARGRYAWATDYQERALSLFRELGDASGEAIALGNLGNVKMAVGEYARALELQEQALAIEEDTKDIAGKAWTLGCIGRVHEAMGRYHAALGYHERALELKERVGDQSGEVRSLEDLGLLALSLGDFPRGLELLERALSRAEELGDRASIAWVLGGIGRAYHLLDRHQEALAVQRRSLSLKRELGDEAGCASTLAEIGQTQEALGDLKEAEACLKQAIVAQDRLGARADVAETLCALGRVCGAMGQHRKALRHYRRAQARAESLELGDIQVRSLWGAARAQLERGEHADALAAARRATERMPLLVGKLAEEQGATAREQFREIFEVGALAAAAEDDAESLAFFLESGRARSMMEILEGREALRATRVPTDLQDALEAAQARERFAVRELRDARARGRLDAVRASRSRLDVARQQVKEVSSRIQRAAKEAAGVLYPEVPSLDELQGLLAPDQALILYGLFSKNALALVVTATDARIANLGSAAHIRDAARAALLEAAPYVDVEALSSLRRLIIDPLVLGPKTTRLEVSPHGILAYVPFAALVGEREVATVPSGAALRFLTRQEGLKGEGVLALGDPRYGSAGRGPPGDRTRTGEGVLAPLPGTAREVEAIGDLKLLGEKATEAGLKHALESAPRWRSVHLACHGHADPDDPLLSWLAVTADEEDDGYLTALEVLGLDLTSDLVVLSACETARGRIFQAEGVYGLTRSCMAAGAPRVIVSLWKVDDEATRALMVKFYELWNPKEGEGIGAAAALRRAQDFVRSHGKWEHPSYWAAWVLWGLPR